MLQFVNVLPSARVRIRSVISATAIVAGFLGSLGAPPAAAQPSGLPLVQAGDLEHVGTFQVPSGFEYSGMALAFNPANNSLFLAGGRESAEIRIPAIGGTASFLQSLRDGYGGKMGNIGGTDHRVGGHLVYNGRLYLTAYIYYDAGFDASASHFARSSLSLSSGSVTGPIEIGDLNPGYYSGYMAPVPTEWQSALGGPAVTGNCCLSIISRTSYGPALFAFNPETMSNVVPLVYYDQGHQTLGQYGASGSHPDFNGSTRITGVVLPPGTNTALFFGATGVGDYCYGTGSSCGDPESPYQGEHAYPYRAYVWAYRLTDLAAVRSGSKEPWQVTPYATWQLSQFGNVKPEFGVGGAAYDPSTRRLYVSQRCGTDPNGSCAPLVHVYELAVGSSAPPLADTQGPSVSISSPAAGATVSGNVTVTASATDNVGVASVWFTLDGDNLGSEDTSAPYQVTWPTTGASNGTHTLRAVARDAAGNATTSSAVTVTVSNAVSDTTLPTVSVTSPSSGATLDGTVTIAATASDNVGVTSVQFTLDGTNIGAPDTSAPYQITWSTAGTSNGAHTIRAVARDAAGNTRTSNGVGVTISNSVADTTSPTVSMTSPSSGANVTGTVTLRASAADDVGVTSVQFTLDGTNLGTADTSAPYEINWNTATASNGSHLIRAVARDAAGNTTTSSAVTVNVSSTAPSDTVAPNVSVTSPGPGATVSGSITLRASASDNVGVVGVRFTVDGVTVGAEDTSSPFRRFWNSRDVANGTHQIRAVARDAAGNVRTSSAITITVDNGPTTDSTAPSVSMALPASGSTVSGVVTVTANASDNVGVASVQFTLDGSNLGTLDVSAPYEFSWNTTSVSNGTHTLRAIARDAAGNQTTSSSRSVTVSNASGPAPSPASGVIVQIDSPGAGQTIRPPFAISGWAIDTRSSNGSGVLFMQAWAVPHDAGRAPVYLGWITPNNARDEVAQTYGTRFRYSGFEVALSNIPPGGYTLALFPYSSATGAFEHDRVKTVSVNVLPGAVTTVDAPVWGQVFGNAGVGMTISGWAVDARINAGTGVDAVHIWAVNAETAAGTFLGSASLGIGRSEPVTLFGSGRFGPSGYSLTNMVPLAPGAYYILVLSHSNGLPTFNVATMTAAIIQ